jgi:hypothetical protein
MGVPCPVPLLEPWSPAGYQVVDVSDHQAASGPASGRKAAARSCGSSPLGYRIVEVAEEKSAAAPPQAEPAIPWARSVKRLYGMDPHDVRLRHRSKGRWHPAAVAVVVLVLVAGFYSALLLATYGAARVVEQPRVAFHVPAPPPAPADNWGQPVGRQVVLPNIPEAPADDAADKAPAPKDNAAPPNGPAGLLAQPACETFGTSVQFARNPQEAFRVARAEQKLSFVLHVSGDFEDAAFT